MSYSLATVFAFEGYSNAQQPLEKAQALLTAVASSQVSVSYLPPWALEGLITQERLQAWFDFHLQVLVLRGQFAERVTLGRALPTLANCELELRAALFERTWPEWWDLYESLESVADLNGEEPAFRQVGIQLARADILNLFNAATRLPSAEAELEILQQQAKESEAESSSLLLQLHEVQEALEKHSAAAEQLSEILAERDAALGKLKVGYETALHDLRQSKEFAQKQAVDTAAAAEKSAATVNALEQKVKEAEAEGELLLLQLHQVQEELEKHFLASEQLTKTLAERDAALGKLKAERETALNDLKQSKDAAQKQAADASKAAQKQAEDAAAAAKKSADITKALEQKVKESEAEGELLLLQLHQVQEELEKHFLASEQLTKTLAERDAALVKLKAERDAALVKLKAERETALNDLKQSKDAAQKQAADASKAAQKQADDASAAAKKAADTTKALEQKVKEAEAEGELLLLQLHQVQEELEKHFLEAEKLTKTLAERDAALVKLKAEREAALNDVKQSKAAGERSTAAEDALTEKLKEAEAESELLLLQLHQVQEELERQFLNSNALETEVKLAAGVLSDVRGVLAQQMRA